MNFSISDWPPWFWKSRATVTSCQQSDDMESCLRVRYDAYLIDLHMPGRDGVSVAHAIRTKHPDARIIALTADVVTPLQSSGKMACSMMYCKTI